MKRSTKSEKTMEPYVASSPPLSAEELTAYIVPKAEWYRRRFERFTRTGATRFGFSWNNPAAFLGIWWYLYRKMYWWALFDFVLGILLGWTLFVPILWGIARGVTANYLYFRQADRKIREARPLSSAGDPSAPNAAHLARLGDEGGVNAWVPWVAIGATLLVAALGALFFGMVWNAIPQLRELWPNPPGRWM